jgi:hypothetical protein
MSHFPKDLVSVLSIASGAAVIGPSMISLVLILVSIGSILL